MNTSDVVLQDTFDEEDAATFKPDNPLAKLVRIITQSARYGDDVHGLGIGERAALARLDPDGELRPNQIAALSRVLVYAGMSPENWRPDTWKRWALIAHGIALAGHDRSKRLGRQLSDAGVSESRVTKLLTARGDAFTQLVPKVLRLLASKSQAPNWFDLGNLILQQERDEEAAENTRLRIAGGYFSSESKNPKN